MRQFERMSEEYSNKNYPQGSIFASIDQQSKKQKIGVYIFFIPMILLFGGGALFCLVFAFIVEDTLGGLIISAILGLVAGLCLWALLLTRKRSRIGSEGWLAKVADDNKYTEGDLREFDRQALASDSVILDLLGGVSAVLSDQKKGICSRDFVYFANGLLNHKVMKHDDIQYACFVQRILRINVNKRMRSVPYLTITLASKQGTIMYAETDMERGTMLIDLLLEKNPNIDTNNKQVLSEKEFETYIKS